jgi:hypothetical protein
MSYYTLRNGLEKIVVKKNNKVYHIGFKNLTQARSVMYNINPYKKITYLPGIIRQIEDMNFDNCGRIIIPKADKALYDSIVDSHLHVINMYEKDFLKHITTKSGVIIPYKVLIEDPDDIIFSAFMFEKTT